MNYLLAHMIEKPRLGSTLQRLPLHMTVVHWFLYEGPTAQLLRIGRDVASHTDAFVATVGEEDMFGTNLDTLVNRVDMSEDVIGLHSSFLHALGKIGVEHTEPIWTGAGYNAHVTQREGHKLEPGDSFEVDSVDLLRAVSIQSERILIGRFSLRRPLDD